MGILRLFLALSVLSGHCESSSGAPCPVLDSHIWVHGYVAVCGFFIISGFYMAMVLDRKYRANIGAFYLNRAARLAPVYWIVLLLFVVGNLLGLLAAVEGVNDPHSGQQMASLSALIANITLIPAPFAAAMDGFRYSSPWDRLISGQMFTVGLELMFYALVPLLVSLRRSMFVLAVAAALLVHFAPCALGVPARPWQYEFVPTILVFFLLGMAAYRMSQYTALSERFRATGWLMLPVIGGYTYVFHDQLTWGFTNSIESWGLYLLVAFAVPVLFAASKTSRIDERIGDLSYPVYVCHFLVIAWVASLAGVEPRTRGGLVVLLTLAVAAALVVLVEIPLQRLRANVADRAMKRRPIPGILLTST